MTEATFPPHQSRELRDRIKSPLDRQKITAHKKEVVARGKIGAANVKLRCCSFHRLDLHIS